MAKKKKKTFLQQYTSFDNKRKQGASMETREKRERETAQRFTSNPDNADKVKSYNSARKEMGMESDSRLTTKKYKSYFGNEKTGDKGIYKRWEEYNARKNPPKKEESEKKGPSFDDRVESGLKKVGQTFNELKYFKNKMKDKVEKNDVAKKITNVYRTAGKTVFNTMNTHQKVDAAKAGVKGAFKALDKVDQYGGASSVRNTLANATDKKNQSLKEYMDDIKKGFTGERRAKGEEIAKNLGVKSKYGAKAAGFGIEAVADPTNIIGAGIAKAGLKGAKSTAKLIEIANKTGKISRSEAKQIMKGINDPKFAKAAETTNKPIEVKKEFKGLKLPTATKKELPQSAIEIKPAINKPVTKPVDLKNELEQMRLIHKADRDDFIKRNQGLVESRKKQADDELRKQLEQEMEWEGHVKMADEYKKFRQRVNIPEENWNDFAVNLPKHLVSAKGSGKGNDIYKLADDMGFENVDQLVDHMSNAYKSQQIVKGGRTKFVTQQARTHDELIDELYNQSESAKGLNQTIADLETKVKGSKVAAVAPAPIKAPINAMNQAPSRTQRLQSSIEMARKDPGQTQNVINRTNDLIKELDEKHIYDEELQDIKEELKSHTGIKLDLQMFANKPEEYEKFLKRIEKVNERADKLILSRAGKEKLAKMTTEERIDHELGKHKANIDYLSSKLDDIDDMINSPHYKDNFNTNVATLKNDYEARLHHAYKRYEVAEEARGSLATLQNHKDVASISTGLVKPMRQIEKSLGKDSTIYKNLEVGQQEARVKHANLNNTDYEQISNIEKLIGKKKKSSALLQDFGEKQLPAKRGIDTSKMSKEEIAKLNEQILMEERPKDFQNFIEADRLARVYYDDKIESYNKVMQETYPNDSSKLIQKREDYYHHFNEMGEGIAAIANRIKHENLSKISPELEGLSKYTKPMTQWVGQKMARLGGAYTSDSIGGMVKTSQELNKAIAWTPQVGRLRANKEMLAMATEQSRNINNVLRTMDNYAGKLANKSGDMDRWVGDNVMSRMGVAILNDVSNLVKNNTLAYSLRVVLAQTLTAPHGFAAAKSENIIKGIPNTLRYLTKNEGPASKSPFLMERLGTKDFRDFKHSAISKLIDYGHFLPGLADRLTVPMYWNGIYADLVSKNKKLIKNGVIPKELEEELINEADKLTSEIVGGRGVGDKSFAQESKVYNTLDPFQLEPQSQWLAMGRMFGGLKEGIKTKNIKQIAGSSRRIAEFGLYSYLIGEAFKYMTGSDAALNPVDDVKRGIDEGGSLGGKVGYSARNLAGDFITSGGIPLAQTLGNVTGLAKDSKKIFGKDDPFRFAQGGMLVSKPLQEVMNGNGLVPEGSEFFGNKLVNRLPASLLMPTGKAALERAIKGNVAAEEGGVFSKSDPNKMLYPVGDDYQTRLKAMTMGTGSLDTAQKYFDKNTTPLSDKQTLEVLMKMSPEEREKAWQKVMDNRGKGSRTKPATIKKQEERRKQIEKLKQQK